MEQLPPPSEERWVLEGDRGLTWSARLPRGSQAGGGILVAGGLSRAAADLARQRGRAGLRPQAGRSSDGQSAGPRDHRHHRQSARGRLVDARRSISSWSFPRRVLEAAPQTHIATVRVDPAERAGAGAPRDRSLRQYLGHPGEGGAGQRRRASSTGSAPQSRPWPAIALVAGIAVLSGAVLADRRRRIYDAVVLKVLGATRGNLLAGLALEYGLMGLATSLIALLAGQPRRLWLRPLGDGRRFRLAARRGAGHGGRGRRPCDPHRPRSAPGARSARRQHPCCATIRQRTAARALADAASSEMPASDRLTA